MKLYVVTDGSYEEYHIVKIFSNEKAAEEYREWNNIHNLVEEFDLEDEMILPPELHKVYFMELCANVYPEGLSDIRYSISKRLHTNTASANYYHETPGKKNSDQFYIRVLRNIPAENFDEAVEKEAALKTLYDIAAIATSLRAQGADKEEIRIAINS